MFWLRLKKLCLAILDPFLLVALLKGAMAGTEHRSALQGFNFDFIVDVGANRGQFALIARNVFPLAKIHSFEPLEEPGQIFQKIFGNDPNVIFYPYAIGREKTTSTIHVTKDDDSSSMLPITKTQSTMFPGATEKETRQVTVLPLSQALGDTSIPPASLLKIDVQGFEILSQFRGYFQHTKSVLMDFVTFEKFFENDFGTQTNICTLLNLTDSEQKLYEILKTNNWRLEQEKIPYDYVNLFF